MSTEFEKYDRITDILMYLSSDLTLNFNITLSSKAKDGSRRFFQFETESGSKYIGTDKAHNIKRAMNFYFTIDDRKDWTNGLILKPQDVYLLTKLIEDKLLPLFFQNSVYKIIEDKLVITGKYDPIMYTQNEYKCIRLDPIVFSYEDGTFGQGVRIEINSNVYADIDFDKFMGFYYILKNTDMYSTAATMVNYVKIPPYGINVYRQAGLGGGVPEPDFSKNYDNITNDKPNNKSNSNNNKGSNDFLNSR